MSEKPAKKLLSREDVAEIDIEVWSSTIGQHPVLSVYWGDKRTMDENVLYIDIEEATYGETTRK